MVTAMGVSVGLTAAADHVEGHHRAEGALGAAAAHAREDRRLGDHRAGLGLGRLRRHEVDRAARRRRLRAERQQDLHHQRSVRRHHRLHLQARRRQRRRSERKVLSFVLDRGMPGLTQSKPLRKMGMHSSPTGELFLEDVRVGTRPPASARPRTRPARSGAKATFSHGAHRRRRDGARHRRAVPGALPRLRAHPRAVRPADRRVPAHPAEARQDGSGAHEHPEHRLPPDRDGAARASR